MEFILPAPKLLLYLGIGLIMLGILVFLGIIKGRKSELSRKIGAVITMIIGIILFLQKNSGKIIVEEDQFTLKALYFRTFSIKNDNIQKIWIQDLQNSEWKPVKRKAGTSLEGISSGRFRLQNGQSAFVVLDGYRALCIETKDGDLALFGVEEFDGFIDKIKSLMPQIQI